MTINSKYQDHKYAKPLQIIKLIQIQLVFPIELRIGRYTC